MSNLLENEYKKLSTKFLKMSLREQFLILICGLVVLMVIMYTFLLEPQVKNSEKLQQNTKSAENEMVTLVSQVTTLTNTLKTDPNEPVRERINDLQRQIQSITQQLESQTNNLVPANKMASMLENVLADSKGVKLIELQSIAPIPILFAKPEEDEEPEAGLYRHGLALVFQGSYFDIQRYLEKLESLPWQFYWKKFDYLVDDYPNARVELEIYTLSTNQAFIGV